MSLALRPLVVSEAPQHFISAETQATYGFWFAHLSICSAIFLHSGVPRAVGYIYMRSKHIKDSKERFFIITYLLIYMSFRNWRSNIDPRQSGILS